MKAKFEDEAAIGKLAEEWAEGWNSGDAEALLSFYADDPVLLPQGVPAVVGKDAIRALYEPLFKAYTIKGEGRVLETGVSGDLGYLWNSYTLTATPKGGGEPVKSAGKSVFILRRQADGSWKVARLIDNSDGEP